jgi:hypothetical protein
MSIHLLENTQQAGEAGDILQKFAMAAQSVRHDSSSQQASHSHQREQ